MKYHRGYPPPIDYALEVATTIPFTEDIQQSLFMIDGVEKCVVSKYKARLEIGELFDPEIVRDAVVACLQEMFDLEAHEIKLTTFPKKTG